VAPSPRPNPPCPPSSPSAIPIGGNLRQPYKLRDARPVFPVALRGTSTEGLVVLDAVIGLDGFIKDVSVRNATSPAVSSALIEAVKQWQYDSTLLNCVPVEVSMTITGRFVHEK
jgi:hypothetical protein